MSIINICTPSIIYLSFGLAGLFIGIENVNQSEIIQHIFIILTATFLINMLCINGLENIAWYIIILFLFFPIVISAFTLIPIVNRMLSKKPIKNPVKKNKK